MPQNIPPHSRIRASIQSGREVSFFQIDGNARRLQWNENPFDYPADLKETVLARLATKQWSHYPLGFRAYDLTNALAAHYQIDKDMIVIGNGSSDLLKIILSAIIEPGDQMVVPTPTFFMYQNMARLLGGHAHEVTLEPDANFALPIEEIIETARRTSAKLIAICSPNNPTGTVYQPDELATIADKSDALLVIDAAYGEFCGQNLLPLVADYENVITVHTFSKAYAMAGVRVGYAIATPLLARELEKLVTSFTLSLFSETAAVVALEHHDRFLANVQQVVQERERVAAELAQMESLYLYPSGTNFLLFRLDHSADDAAAFLYNERNILVSNASMYPTLPNHLRISISSKEDNDIALDGLRDFLATR